MNTNSVMINQLVPAKSEKVFQTSNNPARQFLINKTLVKRPKILYIEDSISIQTLVKHSLSEAYDITTADNCMQGLSYLMKGELPDLILTDLNTPELNGFELLQQLKSNAFFNAIPVLVLSSEEGTEIRIKCLEAGADDYMLKPFSTLEVQARINVVLRRSWQFM